MNNESTSDKLTFVAVTLRSGTQRSKVVKGDYSLSRVVLELVGLRAERDSDIVSVCETEIMPSLRMGVA